MKKIIQFTDLYQPRSGMIGKILVVVTFCSSNIKIIIV